MSANRPHGDADLAAIGALLAEPARAKVLLALGDGRALAASVLAAEAGVSASTASHHLAKLLDGGLITVMSRGRHRYYALAGPQIGAMIEVVARVAPIQAVTSLRQGTRAFALRYARRCYDHLAGRLAVAVNDALHEHGLLAGRETEPETARGLATGIVNAVDSTVTDLGAITLSALGVAARPGEVVRECLDWSEQRDHVAGPLGRSLMSRFLDLGWLVHHATGRAVCLTDAGRKQLPERLGVSLP